MTPEKTHQTGHFEASLFEVSPSLATVRYVLESSVAQLQESVLGGLFAEDRVGFKADLYGSLAEIILNLKSIYPTFDWDDLSPMTFINQMIGLKEVAWTDIIAAMENDPATDDPYEVLLCYPGFRAVLMQRIAHLFWQQKIPLLPRLISSKVHQQTGIDIHPGAKIGTHFFIDHGSGTVVGETTEIGNNVTLYQGVTLGAKKIHRDSDGRVMKHIPRHPLIGDRVTVYAGATILGRIQIGEGSVIGGNVWITESVAPHSRITQQHFVTQGFTDGDGI